MYNSYVCLKINIFHFSIESFYWTKQIKLEEFLYVLARSPKNSKKIHLLHCFPHLKIITSKLLLPTSVITILGYMHICCANAFIFVDF